jgi:hypothetical protein
VKTDELIALLATGVEAVDARSRTRGTVGALAAGVGVAVVLVVAVFGMQTDLAQEVYFLRFWWREFFCAALALVGLICVHRLVHPGVPLGRAPVATAAPLVLMCLAAAYVLLDSAPERRLDLLLGHTARVCSVLIAAVSAPVFAAVIWVMRRYAPTRLRLSGAAAGLASGGVGALVYTLHCPELAPPFVAIWYVVGICIPAACGALFGPRLLRW